VLWVNLLAVDNDVLSHDRLLAKGANLVLSLTDLDTDGLALQAQRITFIFLVLDTQQACTTLGAGKVFWVISTVLETDALVDDRLLATIAPLTKHVIVTILAVHLTLFFHEFLGFKDLALALEALEALRMVFLITHSKHTADDWLSAN